MPNSKRPSLMWSTVATSSAMRSGWFRGNTWTAVPTRRRRVRAAMALATWSEAEMIERVGVVRRLEYVPEGPGLGGPVAQLLDEDPEVHGVILARRTGAVKPPKKGAGSV